MASVLVTGTSSGIGLATALAMSRAGHQVYATVRDSSRASRLAEEVGKERLPVSILTMDVDSDASVKQTIDEIYASGRNIDAVVNNAGIERLGSIEELSLEVFRAAMETNYFGALRCIKAVLPRMRQSRNGCIVNLASVAGRIAVSPFASYNASKFALEALSEVLAQEVKPFNVRVAIVEPGMIDTPMAERIATPAGPSLYPHRTRIAGLFRAALPGATSPVIVAEKIREIIESGTWQLRHLVGADAQGFLDWRAARNDEGWVDLFALDDDGWYTSIQTDFGIDTRPRT
jgi:NAD(P)-dependent dehydrogenase (short-subunit alcohol dehydrogenase family)